MHPTIHTTLLSRNLCRLHTVVECQDFFRRDQAHVFAAGFAGNRGKPAAAIARPCTALVEYGGAVICIPVSAFSIPTLHPLRRSHANSIVSRSNELVRFYIPPGMRNVVGPDPARSTPFLTNTPIGLHP